MTQPFAPFPGLGVSTPGGGGGGGAILNWYAAERNVGNMWVTDPTFAGGAVGNGVANDAPAINAANTAAQNFAVANGGGGIVFFPNPPVAYLVNTPIAVNYRAHWKGAAVNIKSGIIRAGAAMAGTGPIVVRVSTGSPSPEGGGVLRALFEDLTIDGNNLADYGIFAIVAEQCEFKNITFVKCLIDGMRTANQQGGITIGAVVATVPGGSPAGVTIAQIDQFYTGLNNLGTPGVYTYRIQCVTPGALDTARFVYSIAGGPLSTVSQPISATSLPAVELPVSGVAQLVFSQGLTVGFPAGAYAAGDHWDTTITVVAGDYGQAFAASPNMTFYNPVAESCGTNYATAGVVTHYPARSLVMPGTLTLTANTNIAKGTATQFTTMLGAGKRMFFLNADPLSSVLATPCNVQVAAVLSDLELAISAGSEFKIPNGAALPFGIIGGGLFTEDGLGEPGNQLIVGGRSDSVGCCFAFNNAFGPKIILHEFFSCTINAMMGYAFPACKGASIDCCQSDSTSQLGYYFGVGSQGVWQLPRNQHQNYTGNPQGWFFFGNQSFGPISILGGGEFTFSSATLELSTQVNIANHTTTIPPPSLDVTSQNPVTCSFQRLNCNSGDVTLDSIPVIATPTEQFTGAFAAGLKLRLQNVGATAITFLDHQVYLTGISLPALQVVLRPQDIMTLVFNPAQMGRLWYCVSIERAYGGGRGNVGEGDSQTLTTNATPTNIYPNIDVQNTFIAAGTAITFDIQANTGAGTSWAFWQARLVSDSAGTFVFTKTLSIGNNAGAPPAGWDVTAVGALPFVNIKGTGAAATSVQWTVKAHHCDGAS